jgi:inorganic pyrophosphatase/exopolyphosphatase
MGNEACDLDSTVSALTYAYLLHNEMSAGTREVMVVIPLLNILKKQLPLRTEVTYYLQRNSIPLDHLIFQLGIRNEDSGNN